MIAGVASPTTLVFVAGLAIRLVVAVAFRGSYDIDAQLTEGRALLEGRSVYGTNMGNKLPLGYAVPALTLLFGAVTGVPAYVALKMPAIAGDMMTAALLGRVGTRASDPAWLLPALYLLNPVTVMLSAYHGNVDPLMAALVLAATVLASSGRALASGVVLGTAIALKQPAVLALPVLCLGVRGPERARLALAALLVPAVVTLPFAVADPNFGRVLRYSSVSGGWGVSLLLQQSANVVAQLGPASDTLVEVLARANLWFAAWGRYVLLAILIAWYVALVRRRREADRTDLFRDVAATFLVFYVFASGFGTQYLAWALPFLFLVSRRLALVYVAVLTPFLAGTYFQATLHAKYDVGSITAHLRLLSPGDLAVVLANGVFGVMAWVACAWILARIAPPRTVAMPSNRAGAP
jgi:hypothetical protein